jgi:hypothetical protein
MPDPTPGVLVDGTTLASVLQLDYDTDESTFDQVASAADAILGSLLTASVDHSAHPACREAAISVATELYQARTSVGGQPVSLDFTPGPYRLSSWLTRRVSGVVGSCLDVGTMVG